LYGVELVGEHGFRVVEQTSDECGFPVVHASGGGQPQQARHLEVSLPLTILHGGFGEPVVRSGGSTLGESTGLHLGDDLLHGGGVRFDGPGARTVTGAVESNATTVEEI